MNFIEGIIYMIWRGIAIGVIISAPMGPVGILCVQRTLEKGRRTGFFTGVGAAISDLFYCLLTGFGLSLIEDFLKANQNIIQIVGSVVLIVFGIYLFRSNPARTLKKPDAARTSRRRDVLQGFLFTFSNPLIIFLIIGLFARFNFLLPEINWIQYVVGYVSIISGALIWWWIVSFFVDKVRSHFNLRSMWLINRITGAIIMLFALVGVFTAVSGMANAANGPVRYLNSERGFGDWIQEGEKAAPLVIKGDNGVEEMRSLPLHGADEFALSFRASDAENRAGNQWAIRVSGKGRSLEFRLKSEGKNYDELYAATLEVQAFCDGEKIAENKVSGSIAPSGEWNSFCLKAADGVWSLLGGNREYMNLISVKYTPFFADSVAIKVYPRSSLAVDYVALELPDHTVGNKKGDLSHFADPDVRESYFERSQDPLEGVWEFFDRSLDESCLKPGGDYRLAIVHGIEGYDMYYLAGAVKNSSRWLPGATKGRLIPTAHKNVYNVAWLDPAATLLEGEIKAQFVAPDLLVLQFVDHNSSLRMRKIPLK